MEELVVLLSPEGTPIGTARKSEVHAAVTPYHLAFSCYVFDAADRLLLTRRALTKATFPGVWTNSCCGHPAPQEEPEQAVRRRLRHELGLEADRLVLALPDFSYRASADGIEEHELCPVFLARVSGEPEVHDDEVHEVEWTTWEAFVARATAPGSDISPWAQLQVRALGEHVARFLAG